MGAGFGEGWGSLTALLEPAPHSGPSESNLEQIHPAQTVMECRGANPFGTLALLCRLFERGVGFRRLGLLCLASWVSVACLGASSGSEVSAPPVFRVDRYRVEGSQVLGEVEVGQVFRDATGPRVSLVAIRQGMLRLRQLYRDRGFPRASVTLPRQALTNGVVLLKVSDAETPTRTEQPAVGSESREILREWRVPTYDIRHFEIRGNSVLTPEMIDELLGPAAGPAVNLDQLELALKRLQAAYREKGYPVAVATMPQQLLTDGTVSIVVREGPPGVKTTPVPAEVVAVTPPPEPPKGPTFVVSRYDVVGNTLLKPEVLNAYFTNAVGTNVTLPQIQKALGELQMGYRDRGFATVSVGLPQQQLTNGAVRVQVTEGVLTDIRVTGNRYFSSNNVVRTLPSLRTNSLINSRVFQRELDLSNQNRDRQIYPTLGPGPDPGTSSLELRVKDRLPLHGRMDVDNYATPRTPNWRINTSAQYNNLWQEEHQVGVSYGFSPQQYKDPLPEPDLLLNRPLISFFSAYYRLPMGGIPSVEDQINSATTFGYNEATRQFVLPPAGSRPELIFYGSAAPLDTGVQYGPERIVTQTPLLTIVSQDTGQNLTWADDLGSQYSRPWVLSDTRRLGGSAGIDWKRFVQQSFNTNNFIITTVVTNSQGSQTIVTRVSSPQPTRKNQVTYVPLNTGGNFSLTDSSGTLSGTVGLSYNFTGDSEEFQILSGARRAKAEFGKGTVSLVRDQKLFGEWSLFMRMSGQGATGPLIGNEQFSLGGINSVRGYFEGEVFGDSGWFTSAEIRTPYLVTQVPVGTGDVPAWLRGSLFVDSGQAFLIDRGPSGEAFDKFLWGAGFGLSLNIDQRVYVRFALAWPFADTPNVTVGDPRAYFTLEGQF